MLKQLAKPGEPSSGSICDIHVDHDGVREQLERLIASPSFSQSKRYSGLLRYVVEETLEGRAARLKERTVGIDVFHRDPSYDTTTDPVVRTTAAQLRHRLARYYGQPGHEEEIRIGLPAGAYVPEFRNPVSKKVLEMRMDVTPLGTAPSRAAVGIEHPVEDVLMPKLTQEGNAVTWWPAPRSHRLAYGLAIMTSTVLAMFLLAHVRAARADASLRKFWGPVWDSNRSVLICIGQSTGGNGSSRAVAAAATTAPSGAAGASAPADSGPTVSESLSANSVAWPDAMVTAQVAGLARSSGQTVRMRKSGLIAFADLRESPDVLVGGFNNQWIMRLGANLRFRYMRDPDTGRAFIQDRQHPEKEDRGVFFGQPYSTFLQDYGVITRVLDPSTERTVVIASGIASYGTMAAGDFLTEEKYMKMLADRAPAGWERKNVQVVFSTDVISGNAGPPRILEMWFW